MSDYFNEAKLNEDATKKLIVACADANRPEVEKIIANDPNIRKTILEKNNQGDTALHVTATGGDHYILQCLLEAGGELNVSDYEGRTPLMKSALLGNLDCVQVIINWDPQNIFVAGSTGLLPLHCACLISHLDLVSQFIDLDPTRKTVTTRDKAGNTPFLCAANPPIDVKVFDFLLQNGSDVNEMNDKDETALLIISKAGSLKAMEFLLEKGAKFVAAKNGVNPLHECAFRKYKECVRLLLNHFKDINIEAETSEGETAMTMAAAGGDVEICKILFEKNPKLDLALHAAVKYERDSVVQLLLSKKVNPNALNANGETPLFIAVNEDFTEIVQALLEGGADPTIKCNSSLSKKGPITPGQLNKLKKGNKEIGKMLKKAEKDGCNIQ